MTLMSKFSKLPTYLLASYMNALQTNPIRTKSLTSCALAIFGNYVSQKLTGCSSFNYNSLFSFAAFGLLFGGSIPHLFYTKLDEILTRHIPHPLMTLYVLERVAFMPVFSFFTLFFLTWFEGKPYKEAMDDSWKHWYLFVKMNFKYLSLLQYLNVFHVPPSLRVLTTNIIGLLWVCLISYKRHNDSERRPSDSSIR